MEHRRAPRIAVSQQIVVLAAQRLIRCWAVDLSATGMLVLPPARAAADLPLSVDFAFAGVGDRLRLAGRIAREGRYDGLYAWGICFVDVPPAVAAALQRAIHRQSFKNVIASALDEAIAATHGALVPRGAEPLTSIDSGVLGVRARPVRATRSAVDALQPLAAHRGSGNPLRPGGTARRPPRRPPDTNGGRSHDPPTRPRDLARLYQQALAEISGKATGGR